VNTRRKLLSLFLALCSGNLAAWPDLFPWRWEVSLIVAALLALTVTLLFPSGQRRRSLFPWAIVIAAVAGKLLRPHIPEQGRALFTFLLVLLVFSAVWWSTSDRFRGRHSEKGAP
jgi:hypothetical protein